MNNKIAIMQPYFLPYIGYWQLLNAVDKFVIYDDIEFTKKGWINRNRFLRDGKDVMFSLPLKKASDYLYISQRTLSDDFKKESKKLYNKLAEAYKKALNFNSISPLLKEIIFFDNMNLFQFVLNSIVIIKDYLNINTEIIISSSLNFDNSLKSQEKVIEICKTCKANTYINPIGGLTLYDKNHFEHNNINLNFHKMDFMEYKQFNNSFVAALSIIDVMMFNSVEEINKMLEQYTLE